MPEQIYRLKAFISSPSDVNEEKKLLMEIIKELNKTWLKNLKIYLEYVSWESDCYSDMGDSAQDVINKQINDDYDIFIGIMWKKFGTPTNLADSGTEEEFNRAYKKYKENPKDVSILFYFNDTPVSPSNIETDQLLKINNFKKKLGGKGSLYWSYKDLKEFEQLLRVHLSKHLQDWGKKFIENEKYSSYIIDKNQLPKRESNEDLPNADEELGLLDLVDIQDRENENLKAIISKMTESILDLGKKINLRTSEIQDLNIKKNKNIETIRKAKKIVNLTAENLNNYNTRMKTEIPLFSKSYSDLISIFSKLLTLNFDLNTDYEEILNALNGVESMLVAITSVKTNIVDFRVAIDSWPNLSSNLNKAKRETLKIIDWLLVEMDKAETLTSEIIKAFQPHINSN